MKMLTILSGCGYRGGFRRTESIRLKIAVLAPIPKPRIRTAVIVKPGDFSRSLTQYRTDARKPRISSEGVLEVMGRLHPASAVRAIGDSEWQSA
jgi:hypothetical protein